MLREPSIISVYERDCKLQGSDENSQIYGFYEETVGSCINY